MNSGIYKILNTINNNFYIGSAKNISKRRIEHFNRLRNNSHKNIILQRNYNKYGEKSFEFSTIENCELPELLIREQYYIDTLNPYFNICKIASSRLGCKHSEETKLKISKSHLNKIFSEETRIRMSNSAKLRKNGVCISIYSKGRNMKGSNSTSAIINEEIAKLIKIDLNNNIKTKLIIDKYKVSRSIVEGIKYNKTWKHVII